MKLAQFALVFLTASLQEEILDVRTMLVHMMVAVDIIRVYSLSQWMGLLLAELGWPSSEISLEMLRVRRHWSTVYTSRLHWLSASLSTTTTPGEWLRKL